MTPELRGELSDEPASDAGCEQGVACRNDAYGVEEPFRGAVFEQEAAGSGAKGVVDVFVEVECRQDEDAW